MSISDFRYRMMDEINQPDSWLNDLSELIKKKKEENELLKKLRESLDLQEAENSRSPDSEEETADDKTC
jgi:hypothetical protein